MDIGLTQLQVSNARSCLNAGTYGTMGVGLGQAIAACVVHPTKGERCLDLRFDHFDCRLRR
jgi:2-hydroxyacyl-CoA lyase 1